MRWLVLFALGACNSDISVIETAACDGQLQAGEETVDGAFDRDGDGYLDGNNPDCVATYGVEALDCDDGDEGVNPAADEVACNGTDEDCDPEGTPDGLDSAACATDLSGQWTLDAGITYQCAHSILGGYLVDISFDTLSVVDGESSLQIAAIGNGQPGTLTGTRSEDGSFVVSRTISGMCTESYTFRGEFLDGTHLDATFDAGFSGTGCSDCQSQSIPFSATRPE